VLAVAPAVTMDEASSLVVVPLVGGANRDPTLHQQVSSNAEFDLAEFCFSGVCFSGVLLQSCVLEFSFMKNGTRLIHI